MDDCNVQNAQIRKQRYLNPGMSSVPCTFSRLDSSKFKPPSTCPVYLVHLMTASLPHDSRSLLRCRAATTNQSLNQPLLPRDPHLVSPRSHFLRLPPVLPTRPHISPFGMAADTPRVLSFVRWPFLPSHMLQRKKQMPPSTGNTSVLGPRHQRAISLDKTKLCLAEEVPVRQRSSKRPCGYHCCGISHNHLVFLFFFH